MLINEITEVYAPGEYPEWFDKAVALKKHNPRMSALEIGRRVGAKNNTVLHWLTGAYFQRPGTTHPFSNADFPSGQSSENYPGNKPVWYDKAVALKKNNPKISAIEIGRQVGVGPITVMRWLAGVPAKGKVLNPEPPFSKDDFPRVNARYNFDIPLLSDFINGGMTDAEIIELIADEKGDKIASQLITMLPALRRKLKPGAFYNKQNYTWS